MVYLVRGVIGNRRMVSPCSAGGRKAAMALPTAELCSSDVDGSDSVDRADREPTLDLLEIDVHGLEVVVDGEGDRLARDVPQPNELVSGDVADIKVF